MRWLVLLLIASPLAAQQRKPIDYALAGVSTALIVADWSQSLLIARRPEGREGNPLLGERPSVGAVNTYFAIALLGNAGLLALRPTARRVGYLAVLVTESACVAHNLSLGWRISF